MIGHPPVATRTVPRCPYTSLFRSEASCPGSMAADPAFQQGPHRSRADQKSEQPLRRLVCTQLVRFGRDRTRDHSRARVSPSLPCVPARSEEHTSELPSLMRISYAAFCLQKYTTTKSSQHTLT